MFGRSVDLVEGPQRGPCPCTALSLPLRGGLRFAPLGLITPETFFGIAEPTPCKTDTRGAHFASNIVHR